MATDQKPNRRRDEAFGKKRERPVDILERSPPVDISAEMGVLGSVLLNPDVCNDLTMVIRSEDFYDDSHRMLYTHIQTMHDTGQKIDVTLLVSRLKDAGEFETIGGAAYLAKLANSVPNAAHAIYYAQIVRNKATLRRFDRRFDDHSSRCIR